jgi:hypothetical protein
MVLRQYSLQPLSVYQGKARLKNSSRCKLTINKKEIKMINFKDLKKGQKIKSDQLGPGVLISGELLESPKQGKGIKKTILIDAKGSEVGLFDEAGSVYSHNIKLAEVDGDWKAVSHGAA